MDKTSYFENFNQFIGFSFAEQNTHFRSHFSIFQIMKTLSTVLKTFLRKHLAELLSISSRLFVWT